MRNLRQVVAICLLLALGSAAALAGSIDGKWVADPNDTIKSLIFVFQTNNNALNGTAEVGSMGPVKISNGKIDGNEITFEVTRSVLGISVNTKYAGTVNGDVIKVKGTNFKGSMDLILRKK
jgi:hypothetical protein